jgi:hypothetical protein
MDKQTGGVSQLLALLLLQFMDVIPQGRQGFERECTVFFS